MNIYICGHGGWSTLGSATVFTTVPAGTEIVFYKEVGNPLMLDEAEDVLKGASTAPLPARTVRAYMQTPDMTIYPCPEFEANFAAAAAAGGARAFMVSGQMKLSEVFHRFPGSRIHWMACSVRELKPARR